MKFIWSVLLLIVHLDITNNKTIQNELKRFTYYTYATDRWRVFNWLWYLYYGYLPLFF